MPDLISPRLGGSLVLMSFLPFVIPLLIFPYIVLRLRNDGPADQQLGMKAGLQSFFSLAIILILAGCTVLSVDWIVDYDSELGFLNGDSEWNSAQRNGLGLILSGLLFAVVYFLISLLLTDRPNWVRVRRAYVGWRFAIHGIVVMFVVTALILKFMEKREASTVWDDQDVHQQFAILLVWVPSWLIHLILLRFWMESPSRAVRDDDRSSARYEY